MYWLCKDCSTQQEQTNAAKDDWRSDPCLVRAFQIWFADAQDDETKYSLKVKRVARNTVESDEGVEGSNHDVNGCKRSIEDHGRYRREEEACVGICKPVYHLARNLAFPWIGVHCVQAYRLVVLSKTYVTENAGQIALLASGVHEAAGCECRCVQCSKAGSGDKQSEDEGTSGSKDLRAKSNGDGIGGLNDRRGKDEKVGYVG